MRYKPELTYSSLPLFCEELGSMAARVLLVDDDPEILESASFLLEAAGYDFETATNGQLALDRVALNPPQLILLDLMMPVMDGWQFVEELRKGPHSGIPIVVLSASLGVGEKAKKLGAQGYLAKPFNMDDLLALLRSHAG